MKFEKFLKNVGTHGLVVELGNRDKWLVCDGVGMKVPSGVVNLLGSGEAPEKVKDLVKTIVNIDYDFIETVELTRAELEADGKPSSIVRVFSDRSGREVGIINDHFGLLEKSDVNLSIVELPIQQGYNDTTKFLLVFDEIDEVIGFIEGVEHI